MNSITLKPEINQLAKLNEFLHEKIPEYDLQMELMVEEVFVNIVSYSDCSIITVQADSENNECILEFIDDGIEFNPLLEEAELPENIEDAKIGGLGIHLVKEISDDLLYSYEHGKNHLKIIKKL